VPGGKLVWHTEVDELSREGDIVLTGECVVALDEVCKHYKVGDADVLVLDRATLELRAGEFVGIVGPSGAGKTTFLMLTGLLDVPTSGEIHFGDDAFSGSETDLNSLRDFRRRHIGFVFQKPNLIPFLNAMQNVQVALAVRGWRGPSAANHANFLLDRFGVGHRAKNTPAQLSGGEQQRIAIARALANGPKLILADEPTASLDSGNSWQVMRIFRELVDRDSVSICMVTHDPRWFDQFDRLVEINDGRIVKN
jgi:putative ABC transport system ATP-binding protein